MTARLVIMGVAGCGKSTVGVALSERLGVPYIDGDDLHPQTNLDKMRQGVPLTDTDRWPWLDAVGQVLATRAPVIVGCSALKRAYRDRLRDAAGAPIRFIYLSGSRAEISRRMADRDGHFMPLSLLDSQFAALEPPGPDEAMTVDIGQPIAQIVEDIVAGLRT